MLYKRTGLLYNEENKNDMENPPDTGEKWEKDMSNVILSADSTCDLTPELRERYQVSCHPYHIILDGQDYLDKVTITSGEIFQAYYDKKILPQTSAINHFEYANYFRKWVDAGKEVVHLNLGGALSASYKNCCTAAQELGHIYPIDSYSLSTGTGLLVIKAAEMAAEGMGAAEIQQRIEAMRGKVHASFILDTLKFMHAGGRCSGVTAFSANMLNIKPCIVVDNKSGGMDVGKKYRGKLQKVLLRYVEDTLQNAGDLDLSRIFITYSSLDDPGYVDLVREAILAIAPFQEVHVTTASSTIACHCGPNTLGILFMTK